MYKEKKMRNGLKVIISSMPHMSSVTVGVWIGVGGRHETAKNSGISHFIEHMLFKGTENLSAKDLKQAIEGVGGTLNGFTADEVTCYLIKVPARYLVAGMDILKEMVFNPKFDETDILREKYVVCEEIKMYKDHPSERVHEILEELMWPDDPLGRTLTGSISNVKSLKRNDLIRFKDKYYHPSNMAVVVSGKVKEKDVISYVSNNFTGPRGKSIKYRPAKVAQTKPRIRFSKGKTQQAHIAIGFPVKRTDRKDKVAQQLVNIILGANMSSRLFEELREKQGLCYDIGSSYKHHNDIAEFGIHAGVDTHKIYTSVAGIVEELKKLRDFGVNKNELVRAKEFAKGQIQLGLENTSTRMIWLGDKAMVDGTIPEVKSIIKRIDAIKEADILRVSNDIFCSRLFNMAIIGNISDSDKKKVKKELLKL